MTKLLRSPINYMGGKYRSLKYFQHLLPKVEGTFYDLFAGSGTVLLNANAQSYVYNDINTPLAELFSFLAKQEDSDEFFQELKKDVNTYNLNTKEGFLELRQEYNQNPNPKKLFLLMNHSFSYLIRFNKNGEFNASYGQGKCKLGENMGEKVEGMLEKLKDKNLRVTNKPFQNLKKEILNLSKNDFVYLDPPYELTQANYNENRGFAGWSKQDVDDVYELVEELIKRDIPFGYSNTLVIKGETNQRLKELIDKYTDNLLVTNVGKVDLTGIGTKKTTGKDVEVYITNVKKGE